MYGFPLVMMDLTKGGSKPDPRPQGPRRPLEAATGLEVPNQVLERDLVLTTDDGNALITQDEPGNSYDRVGGAYGNYKP